MQDTLSSQVAVVTGASSGIGRATAIALAAAGASVIVNHLLGDEARGQAVVSEIEGQGGIALALAADVSREDQVEAMFAEIQRRFGGLHILVSNAGIERPAPIVEMTMEQWRSVIDVNLTGAFLCARAAARLFTSQPSPVQPSKAAGKIIFMSSVHETIPWAFQSNYAASKGGLSLLMKSLAQELAPSRIRVNSVAPGAIRTPINREAWETPEAEANLLKLIPSGRVGEPDDVAKAVTWLASDASDYVTGTSLVVDGGMLLFPGFRGAG